MFSIDANQAMCTAGADTQQRLPHLWRLSCTVAFDTAGVFLPACSLLISHLAVQHMRNIALRHILHTHRLRR